MSHDSRRTEFCLVRHYGDKSTRLIYGDLRNAEIELSRTRATLGPNFPASIQSREVVTSYGDWEDVA